MHVWILERGEALNGAAVVVAVTYEKPSAAQMRTLAGVGDDWVGRDNGQLWNEYGCFLAATKHKVQDLRVPEEKPKEDRWLAAEKRLLRTTWSRKNEFSICLYCEERIKHRSLLAGNYGIKFGHVRCVVEAFDRHALILSPNNSHRRYAIHTERADRIWKSGVKTYPIDEQGRCKDE